MQGHGKRLQIGKQINKNDKTFASINILKLYQINRIKTFSKVNISLITKRFDRILCDIVNEKKYENT